ncbi:MAG TPA: hypothetical protein VFD33_04965 [Bacillota bacterium]|nr:hypothetical protein [Bacillota bacterium]
MNYNHFDMVAGQDCMYPIDYHDRYGNIYPSLEPDIHDGMVSPIMYPDIYYRIYPYANMICDQMDNAYMMYPSEAHVESMVNTCYDACIRAMPDLYQYAGIKVAEADADTKQLFRRRPLLRDLIAIVLIGELFRRRRPRFSYGY